MRDQPHLRERGVRSFLENVPGLLAAARAAGLDALTVEPMSSVFEFPSTPDEVRLLASQTEPIHASTPATTVPLLLCADISHGVADAEGKVVHDNWSLFEMEIPWMWEFHIKNTDGIFNSTFGFGPEERAKGIVDLHRLKRLIDDNGKRFPVDEITGYLEIGGPKTGRDYTDHHLRRMLVQSIEALQEVFGKGEEQI
jgi:ribulose-phosphate 3-epimerase